MDEEGIDLFLESYELKRMDHKNADELEKIYFFDGTGKSSGRINSTHGLVRAKKI